MNPCAASFNPGDAYGDAPQAAIGRDLNKKNFHGLASITPPDEREILISSGKSLQDENQNLLGHKHQAAYEDMDSPILPSPAGSPSKNGFASTASSNSGHRSKRSGRSRNFHLPKRASTPFPATNHTLAGRSSLTTSTTIPTSPPDGASSNELLFRSEDQPIRNDHLPFYPIDTTMEFQESVLQSELYAPHDQESFYVQQDPHFFGLPFPFLFEQAAFQPSAGTTGALPGSGVMNSFFTEAPPGFISMTKSKSKPPLFGQEKLGQTSSRSLLAVSPDLKRPKYKLVETTPNRPRTWKDKKPKVSDIIESAKARKAAELTNAPSLAQEASPLEYEETDVDSDLPLSTHPATSQTARPQLGDGIANAINLLIQQRLPPANAPTAPASFRRPKSAAQRPSSLSAQPADAGTWSQSKRWVSKETKERAAFQKMKFHLQYMGADKSPAVPQTPAELTAFRLETTSIKTRKLTRDIFKRQELSQRKKEAQGDDAAKPRPKPMLFNDKKFDDVLSPFFPTYSWFNKSQPGGEAQAKWPTMADFKEHGDHRAPKHGRYFPLPRIDVVENPTQDHSDGQMSSLETGIKQEKGTVKYDSRFILPVYSNFFHHQNAPEDEQEDLPEDWEEAKMPPSFYHFVESIYNRDKEEEETVKFKQEEGISSAGHGSSN
ncbi:unnamed protein product [Clonostachys rosea]|uniref:Uncharacterized protein n=1 Tax=Bionectria ochroleuca TaxID=29856 RepID=A0ABY6TYR9_BIOOC|nr:unnamed protein product [Clonostachys rosea]